MAATIPAGIGPPTATGPSDGRTFAPRCDFVFAIPPPIAHHRCEFPCCQTNARSLWWEYGRAAAAG